MIRNNIEPIKDLIEEIDILLGLLDDPIVKILPDSLLYNKEYEEKMLYNRNPVCESDQKDFILVGKDSHKLTSDKIVYVNDDSELHQSGALMGCKWGLRGRGLKVLGESGLEGKDIVLVFKKSKKIKKGFFDGK